MFQLKLLSEKNRKNFEDRFYKDLAERIKLGRQCDNKTVTLPDNIKDVLLPGWNTSSPDYSVIKKLLSSEPKELYDLNKDLWKKFKVEEKLESEINKKIEQIFNYDGVFVGSKGNGYWLAKLIERNTCPYCNRQYCFTVERDSGKNDADRIVRPSFDHWFLKSKYPLLSLSLYNLIPSCYSCNSSVRGKKDLLWGVHLHPYVKEPASDLDCTFRACKKGTERFAWSLKIDRKSGSRIDETIKAFALDEIYSYHEKLEVKDIMEYDARYRNKYLSSLFRTVLKDSRFRLSREEVFRMLFGSELKEDKFLDRPFSKLKHDLLVQIGVIKDK